MPFRVISPKCSARAPLSPHARRPTNGHHETSGGARVLLVLPAAERMAEHFLRAASKLASPLGGGGVRSAFHATAFASKLVVARTLRAFCHTHTHTFLPTYERVFAFECTYLGRTCAQHSRNIRRWIINAVVGRCFGSCYALVHTTHAHMCASDTTGAPCSRRVCACDGGTMRCYYSAVSV